jgi:hypothetical protein
MAVCLSVRSSVRHVGGHRLQDDVAPQDQVVSRAARRLYKRQGVQAQVLQHLQETAMLRAGHDRHQEDRTTLSGVLAVIVVVAVACLRSRRRRRGERRQDHCREFHVDKKLHVFGIDVLDCDLRGGKDERVGGGERQHATTYVRRRDRSPRRASNERDSRERKNSGGSSSSAGATELSERAQTCTSAATEALLTVIGYPSHFAANDAS